MHVSIRQNEGDDFPSFQGPPVLHLLEQTPETLRAWLAERSLPAYRAGQVQKWLFASRVNDFEEMTDLPKSLRTALAADFSLWTTQIAKHQKSADGTEKLLLELTDKQRIECVLIREGQRR